MSTRPAGAPPPPPPPPAPTEATIGLGARLFVGLQYLLPHHGISRLVLAATRVRRTGFKNALIRGFLRLYRIDLAEAVNPEATSYPSFNDFFTRALIPAARPVCAAADAIASPVDGRVVACGAIGGGRLLQAKGRDFSLQELLAGADATRAFEGGEFATIYLAPYNYHRIHMPLAGRLLETRYVPGRLFSVNAATARMVPRLFARNERVITVFETAAGRMAVILVGAMNVGSIATVWAGDITPRRPRRVTRLADAAVELSKGGELGRFNMGSTVILLFEPGRIRWDPALQAGTVLAMGRQIGSIA
jgi:phosphatidylserine decarboxylase